MNLNKAWEGANWVDLVQVKEHFFITAKCSSDTSGSTCGEFLE